MMSETMTLERLLALIAAYGGKPANWPAAERAAAKALLARSPEARAALAEAEPLDTLLDAVPALATSPALRAAVLAGMPQSDRSGRGNRWQGLRDLLGEFGALPAVRPMLFASLLLGLFAGYLNEDNATEASGDLVQLAVYDDAYAEY
jgi:ferric-dicitrate binding protein FerR (iron transport regulator)